MSGSDDPLKTLPAHDPTAESPQKGSAVGELAVATADTLSAADVSEPAQSSDSVALAEPHSAPTSANASAPRPIVADAALANTAAGAPNLPAAAGVTPVPLNWDRYEILELLGKGGMGAVYRARDRRLGRVVALKFVLGNTPALTQRFIKEARAQARIDHAHVCKVFEVGEVQGNAFIAMQFCAGEPLTAAQHKMSLEDKVQILTAVAEAVQTAHRQGIIHRDLKPANIMVQKSEQQQWLPLVMDFGLAHDAADSQQLTQDGALLGTPHYMPPEQARGEINNIDRRSDVYALGAVLYELLTGRTPFAADSLTALLLKVLDEDPVPPRSLRPSVPADLETIALKCLQKAPSQRYESARALADDLQRYLAGEPISARRLGLTRRLGRFLRKHPVWTVLAAAVLLLIGGFGWLSFRAAAQARQAQQLGQEITRMEWLLRSARQMPLHNLDREKAIVRSRIDGLKLELSAHGDRNRGLLHYALGRGHLALSEYPEALQQLQQAIALGVQSPEVHYALGLVLGKHFERAMNEARLAGGGDWARKKLKEFEPKYLQPALAALERGRNTRLDAPQYLEGLIAFYRRDYDEAVKQAALAQTQAPWLYDADKLRGDVYLAQALQTRDRGDYEAAERAFAAAISHYTAASAIGASDPEVYEGLAEALVRKLEMAADRNQPTELEYRATIAAADKIQASAPGRISGHLNKAYAAALSLVIGSGPANPQRLQEGLAAAEAVLQRQPRHPYASDVYAVLLRMVAMDAAARGEEPEARLRKALATLEGVVSENPQFLWGLNDLGGTYAELGIRLQRRGLAESRLLFDKGIKYSSMAAELDPQFLAAPLNLIGLLAGRISGAVSFAELQQFEVQANSWFRRCTGINSAFAQCMNNFGQLQARLAQRALSAGADPDVWIGRAIEHLTAAQKMDAGLDAEQHAALAHLVRANRLLQLGQDPGDVLGEMQIDLERCFRIAAKDVMCQTLAAQADWAAADALAAKGRPVDAALKAALAKATLATQNPEKYPDAWQTLAETHLRLARIQRGPTDRKSAQDIEVGLSSLQKAFAINPNHALGLLTQGRLYLLRAERSSSPSVCKPAAEAAVQAFEQALQADPLLTQTITPLQVEASALVSKR